MKLLAVGIQRRGDLWLEEPRKAVWSQGPVAGVGGRAGTKGAEASGGGGQEGEAGLGMACSRQGEMSCLEQRVPQVEGGECACMCVRVCVRVCVCVCEVGAWRCPGETQSREGLPAPPRPPTLGPNSS